MATPTIPNGEEYFFPIIYEGNGAGQRVGKFVPFTDSGTIDNSCIFDAASNASLTKTPSGAGNRKTFTVSVWAKRCVLTDASGNNTYGQRIFNVGTSSAWFDLKWSGSGDTEGANKLHIREYSGSAEQIEYWTNRTYEDTSKWYHILLVVDTTQSTSTDRIKLYVDGDQVTSWYRSNAPSLNFDTQVSSTVLHNIGRFSGSTSNNLSGYLAEFNFVDGQALLPASFGETDTSTGRWVPSTVKPYPTTTTTFTVTVSNPGSGNKYYIDSSQQATVTLIEGATYRFDQSDSSNSGHPLRFSTTSDGTHGGGTEFTSGVTTVGTPGSSGAYTEITVPTGTATLYYYCTNHSGMGGTANTQDQYGTNGFRLKFQDSSALGDDTSGNTNDFTATNLASTDQTTDSPTQNFSILASNPTAGTATLSEGNLKIAGTGSGVYGVRRATFLINSNDSNGYYFEAKNVGSSTDNINIGLISSQNALSASAYGGSNSYGIASRGSGGSNQYWRVLGGSTDVTTSVSHASNDVIGVAIKQGKIWFAINNTWVLSGDPANGTNSFFDMSSKASEFQIAFNVFYNNTLDVNFGQKSLAYTAPTGFSALQQDNLPETDRGIVGLTWIKDRDNASYFHTLQDSSRGSNKEIYANSDSQQASTSDSVTKFLKGGVAVEDAINVNNSGDSFVAWNWVANSGTTASNSDGSIASVVQANQTAGFSIVQYTGTGSNATVGHGLSSAPEWVMAKVLNVGSVSGFTVGTTADPSGFNNFLYLNETEVSRASSSTWNNTAPTSSVFSVGSSSTTNYSSQSMLAYCWHSVDGFSKFGKYTANGNADGPFIWTGFKPAFTMIKNIDSSYGWIMQDNQRGRFNPISDYLYANATDASASTAHIDFVSNGFKIRFGTGSAVNNSTNTYIYMAFAEHPFVGDGTSPVTAR